MLHEFTLMLHAKCLILKVCYKKRNVTQKITGTFLLKSLSRYVSKQCTNVIFAKGRYIYIIFL